jgi:hypothetical protein
LLTILPERTNQSVAGVQILRKIVVCEVHQATRSRGAVTSVSSVGVLCKLLPKAQALWPTYLGIILDRAVMVLIRNDHDGRHANDGSNSF